MAIALAIYVTATLSGAHFNPAVTITLAVTGRHPWRLVPLYIVCQIVGWFDEGFVDRVFTRMHQLTDQARSRR